MMWHQVLTKHGHFQRVPAPLNCQQTWLYGGGPRREAPLLPPPVPAPLTVGAFLDLGARGGAEAAPGAAAVPLKELVLGLAAGGGMDCCAVIVAGALGRT